MLPQNSCKRKWLHKVFYRQIPQKPAIQLLTFAIYFIKIIIKNSKWCV